MRNELDTFDKWLQSFGGGCKPAKNSKQITKHVHVLLGFMDSCLEEATIVEKLDKIEQYFITDMLKTRQASTVKNYLLSLKKFITWAQMKRKCYISHEVHRVVDQHINHWISSLNKLVAARAHEKKDIDAKNAVTVETVLTYVNGERARSAESYLDKKQHTTKITNEQLVNTRNFLVMKTILTNATRTGPVINVTVANVLAATKNIHNEHHVMRVQRHKTETKYGAAQISLEKADFKRLVKYVNDIRPQVCTSLFLSEFIMAYTWPVTHVLPYFPI